MRYSYRKSTSEKDIVRITETSKELKLHSAVLGVSIRSSYRAASGIVSILLPEGVGSLVSKNLKSRDSITELSLTHNASGFSMTMKCQKMSDEKPSLTKTYSISKRSGKKIV